MQQYKKRLRGLSERYGVEINYNFDGEFLLRMENRSLCLAPTSRTEMSCAVSNADESFDFVTTKSHVFDVVHRFARGRTLKDYNPNGSPLSLQEYIDEENGKPFIEQLKQDIELGVAETRELGGNHYNIEYYDSILIVFDIFTNKPTNVLELAEAGIAG